jgi:hypothetical protein
MPIERSQIIPREPSNAASSKWRRLVGMGPDRQTFGAVRPESTVVLLLSKVVAALASPLGVTVFCLLLSSLGRCIGRRRLGRSMMGIAVAVLWVSATPIFAG